MKAVLAAVGSRGDTVPFGALAARLQAQGHDVVLVAHEALLPMVPAGVPTIGVASDPDALLAGPAARAVRHGNPRALNRARGLFADYLASFAAPTAAALDGADVLIASTFALAAVDEAMTRQVPVVRAHQWPESPGLAGPMPLLPYSWLLPAPVRRGARRGLRALEGYLAGFDGWWERGRLRLVAHHPAGLATATLGTMHVASPTLVPPDQVQGRVTGWWWGEDDARMGPGADARVTGSDTWVYVGFGSMHQGHPQRLLDDVSWAAQRVGVRAAVQLPGAAGVDDGTVLGLGEEPHSALFDRVDLAVHHGGSGTTGAALRAGIPSAVVPHFADQYYWGHRLHAVGAGPRPLPRALLARERLARHLEAGLDSTRRRRAAELGEQVRREDGTGVAARYVAELLERRRVR